MEGRRVFLDTSGLYAAADPAAADHRAASQALAHLLDSRTPLLSTDLVLAEAHGLTLGRMGPGPALTLIEGVARSGRVELIEAGLDRIERGIEFLRSRPGRRLSVTDAVSFGVMWERSVSVAFTLDGDFLAEGFTVLPEPVTSR